MRLNRFDLNLLIALEALLRERSVTRAAERAYVSQPAMSAALAKLREYFADPLLVRVGRDMELTPRGRTLLEQVERTMLDAQELLGSRPLYDPLIDRRTYSVMSPDFVIAWLMPPVFRRLQRQAPEVRIELGRSSLPGLARLAQGDVHLFLSVDTTDTLALPKLADSLNGKYVATLRWVCVVSSDHPEVEGQLTEEQVLRLPHAVARPFGQSSLLELTARNDYHTELNVRAVTESVADIPHLVAGTPLIGVIPAQLAPHLSGRPGLAVLELPAGLVPSSRLDLMWHRSHESDPGHAWLRELILSVAGELSPSGVSLTASTAAV